MVTLDFHVHLTGIQLSVGIAAVASITTHICVGFPSIPSCSSGFVTTGLRLLVKGERGRCHEASCHRGEKRIRFKRSWARTHSGRGQFVWVKQNVPIVLQPRNLRHSLAKYQTAELRLWNTPPSFSPSNFHHDLECVCFESLSEKASDFFFF